VGHGLFLSDVRNETSIDGLMGNHSDTATSKRLLMGSSIAILTYESYHYTMRHDKKPGFQRFNQVLI